MIVHTHDTTFPMEMLDEEPMYDRLLRTLGQAGTLVVFDKPGVGASDPFARDRDYFDQVAEAFVAVLDAVGAPAGWLCGTLTTAAVLMSTCRSRLSGVVSITGWSPASSEAGPALDALNDAFDVMVVDREPFLDGPAFDDLGPRRLKGIERPWNLFSVGGPAIASESAVSSPRSV